MKTRESKGTRKRNAVLESIARIRRVVDSLTLNELEVFFYIAETPGMNVSELAELCGIGSSFASRIVKALSADANDPVRHRDIGLIELLPHPYDLRSNLLVLSDRGVELCKALDVVIRQSVEIKTPNENFKARLQELSAAAEKASDQNPS